MMSWELYGALLTFPNAMDETKENSFIRLLLQGPEEHLKEIAIFLDSRDASYLENPLRNMTIYDV